MKKILFLVLASFIFFSTSNLFARKKIFLIDRKPPVVHTELKKQNKSQVSTNPWDHFSFSIIDNISYFGEQFRLYYIPVTESSEDYVVINMSKLPNFLDPIEQPTEYRVTAWTRSTLTKFLLTLEKDENLFYRVSDAVIKDPGFLKKYELYFKVKDFGYKLEVDRAMLYMTGIDWSMGD